MTNGRRRVRAEWVATGVAGVFLLLAIIGAAFVASHFSGYHSGWREAVPDAVEYFAWMPLLAAAWWVKIRVEDWLNGKWTNAMRRSLRLVGRWSSRCQHHGFALDMNPQTLP